MNAAELLRNELLRCIQADNSRLLLGEDVLDGGMLGLSKKVLDDENCRERILPTPLTSVAGLAYAGGLATAGMRPIVLMPSASALMEGLPAIRAITEEARKNQDSETPGAPVLFLVPTGPGFGLGGHHAMSAEALLSTVPDLRVIAPGIVEEWGAHLHAAAAFEEDQRPTVLLLARELFFRELSDEYDANERPAPLDRPLGGATILREGSAATVFTWGATTSLAVAAANSMQDEVQVVEVTGLNPLDRDTIVQAAQQSGKIVIAHSGGRNGGFGAELAATLADDAILSLDAPILRVTGENGPFIRSEEHKASPSIDAIYQAIHRVIHY